MYEYFWVGFFSLGFLHSTLWHGRGGKGLEILIRWLFAHELGVEYRGRSILRWFHGY